MLARNHSSISRYLFFIVSVLLGAGASYYFVKAELVEMEHYLRSFPEAFKPFHLARPWVLGGIIFLPAVGGLIYANLKTLDRYILRKFLSIYAICLIGFLLIWLLLDIQNTYGDFGDTSGKGGLVFQYYLIQIPNLLVTVSPFVLMLAALFALGQLSTHRELVMMVQTGRSVGRVLAPMFGVGVFLSLLLAGLNYHWTAWGQSYKDGIKDIVKHDSLTKARDVVSANESSGRLWYVGQFPQNYYEGEPLKNVEISFPDENGFPVRRLRVDQVSWDFQTGDWTLEGVSELSISRDDVPRFLERVDKVVYKGWPETPSQLVSPGLHADSLGVPELEDWLRAHKGKSWLDTQPYKTQWHSRFSKPWTCLVAIILAAPLGIVFSRRGAFGGVIIAIVLCLLLFFMSEIFVAMGSSGYMQPWVAAWLPNIIFTIIGGLLLFRRAQNRSIYQALSSLVNYFYGR